MIRIFRRYYLGFFICFLLIFSSQVFSKTSPNRVGINIMICLGGALAGAGIIGTVYYKTDTKWGPAKRQKVLTRPPFTQLFQNGFTRRDDIVVGNIGGYTVILYYTWRTGKSAIRLDVLLDIGFHIYDNDDVFNDLINRNQPANRFSSLAHQWTRNSISCTFEYTFGPPAYEKLVAKAGELIAILVRERLAPMSIDDAILLKKPAG